MREADQDQDQDLGGEVTARQIDEGKEVLRGREVAPGAGRDGEGPGAGVERGGGEAVVGVRVRVGAEGGLGKVRRQEETSQGKN